MIDRRTHAAPQPCYWAASSAAIHSLDWGSQVDRTSRNPDGTNIQGGAGNDTLLGGQFDDILSGGLGDDLLTGKNGADQFRSFGTQIEGSSDTDTITDLNFAEGDTIVLGSFGRGTFEKADGVNAYSNGTSATLDSWFDIVAIDRASDLVSTSSTGANGQDLLLSVIDSDGQVQNIVIAGGYAQYLSAAGGSAGGSGGGSMIATTSEYAMI